MFLKIIYLLKKKLNILCIINKKYYLFIIKLIKQNIMKSLSY